MYSLVTSPIQRFTWLIDADRIRPSLMYYAIVENPLIIPYNGMLVEKFKDRSVAKVLGTS